MVARPGADHRRQTLPSLRRPCGQRGTSGAKRTWPWCFRTLLTHLTVAQNIASALENRKMQKQSGSAGRDAGAILGLTPLLGASRGSCPGRAAASGRHGPGIVREPAIFLMTARHPGTRAAGAGCAPRCAVAPRSGPRRCNVTPTIPRPMDHGDRCRAAGRRSFSGRGSRGTLRLASQRVRGPTFMGSAVDEPVRGGPGVTGEVAELVLGHQRYPAPDRYSSGSRPCRVPRRHRVSPASALEPGRPGPASSPRGMSRTGGQPHRRRPAVRGGYSAASTLPLPPDSPRVPG